MNLKTLACAVWMGVAALSPNEIGAQDRGHAEQYRAILELRIGDIDGPIALTRPGNVVVGDGRVYVSQPQENLIRVVSASSGEILDEWGGAGDGPGEFRRLSWIGLLGDTVLAVDTGLRRITSFSLDGELLGTRRYRLPEAEPPFYFGGWVFPAPGGNLVMFREAGGMTAMRMGGEVSEGARWYLAGFDGKLLDEIAIYGLADRVTVVDLGNAAVPVHRPYHRGDRHAVSPDGRIFVRARDIDGTGLELRVYHTASRRTERWETGIDPVRLDRSTRDRIAEERSESFRAPTDVGDVRDLLRPPESVPAVDELFVTSEGEIWLREPSFEDRDDTWRVVSPEGDLVAEVLVPRGVILQARRSEVLWGFRLDPDLHVPTVEKFTIEQVR